MKLKHTLIVATATLVSTGAPAARATDFLTVVGGPGFDPISGTGFNDQFVTEQQSVNAAGSAVGNSRKYADNVSLGQRAFRWGVGGTAPVELGHLGTKGGGGTNTHAAAIDGSGAAFGWAEKYVGVTYRGDRAVRWNAGSTVAVELPLLGTAPTGSAYSAAFAVNAGGTAVGVADKFDGATRLGNFPVRWQPGAAAPTELGHIDSATRAAYPVAVNGAGTAVGHATKSSVSTSFGSRAVRWDAGGTTAMELAHLGAPASGFTSARAVDVDAAGNAYGIAWKYSGEMYLGERAVRWDVSGSAATELGNLGTSPSGFTNTNANAVNASGTAVGSATRYINNTTNTGSRAVRWQPGATAATELDNLGSFPDSGITDASALAINSNGIAVGWAVDFDEGTFIGVRAALWLSDGRAVNLNSLVDPASGWTLTAAHSISDTNFVAGVGYFDPDGGGPAQFYRRAFVLDATSAIPEPGTVAMLATCLSMLALRHRVKQD